MKTVMLFILLTSNFCFSQFIDKDVKTFFKDIEKERNISGFFERDRYEGFKTAIIYIANKEQKLVAFEEIKERATSFHRVMYNKSYFEFAKQKISYNNILTFSSGGMIDGVYYHYYIVLKKSIN